MVEHLIDTNIVVALFANEPAVQSRFSAATSIFVPVIVVGELYFGAAKSARAPANIARVDAFAAAHRIVDCDLGTAVEYGRIKHLLATKGRPIPENDIWIAALACQHNFVLVTRDHHFSHVDGLQIEAW